MRIIHTRTNKSLLILSLIALASISTAFATRSVAANNSMTFTYLAGSGPLCSLNVPHPCPDVAVADNGDMISVNGSGTFSIFPNSVTGGGMFMHKNATGTVLATGTWVATDLVSFVSYGNQVPKFPPTFFGGRALIKVTLFVGSTAVHTAILAITCDVGSPPEGHHEGITLNVQDAINFNKSVSGVTLFILHT
jgi:hypothetical protein